MTTATIEAPQAETIDNELPDLTGFDRCDRCGSQSYVRVRLPGALSDLTFCGHHYAKHETALVSAGAQVRDERARLTVSYKDVSATELEHETPDDDE